MANAAKKSGPAPMRVVPPGSKPTGRKAVRRKSRKGIKLGRRSVNKTAEIREAALEMVRQGRPPRPVEIVDRQGYRRLKRAGVRGSAGNRPGTEGARWR